MNQTKSTIKPMPSKNSKLSRGLTLIELLVTIAIIGILASLATYSFQESQAKSRDSRRKADLEAIKKAMELAKQDSPGGFAYPRCGVGGATNCRLSNSATTPPLVGANYAYIKTVPTDPKVADAVYGLYLYVPTPPNCTTACTAFTLVTCLENTKDPAKDTANNAFACPTTGITAGTTSFSVTNL